MITLSSDSEPEDILPPPPKRRSIEGVPRTFDNDSRKRFSFGASSILESPPPPPLAKAPPLFQKTPKTIRRRSVSMSCMTTSREEEGINRPPTSQVCSGFVKEAIEEEEEEEEEEETTSDLNLRALLSPEKKQNKNSRRGGKEKIEEVLNEFFGVYCLISRSDRPCYKNRCYIGYTVDPNRRIQQHNGGRLKGGAKKTDSRGPWDMVCVVHGFPNHVAALRFEWAWQNPGVTKALKGKVLKKERKETPFAYQLRIACELMNSETFCRFALTFRWLITTERIPFPSTCPPPSHIRIREGKVQKEMSKVPVKGEEYLEMGECLLCGDDIQKQPISDRKSALPKCFDLCTRQSILLLSFNFCNLGSLDTRNEGTLLTLAEQMSSTPHRPSPYPLRSSAVFRNNSVIRRPMRECRKRVASPVRYSPMSRCAPKEVTMAPKTKRVRQSRLQIDASSSFLFENESPRPSEESPNSRRRRSYLPVQRLQFENPDFMDLYSDDSDEKKTPCRPDSVAFLSQLLTDALKSTSTPESQKMKKKKKVTPKRQKK
uniref:GIY-YIG domain-containing protein n=1 Tax=Caenorhabditis tropicalis TaxID=1561998 RepID=A0A1I7UVC3_9PELO